MLLTQIDFSDLTDVSPQTRSSWEGEIVIRDKYRHYFDGRVFQSKIPLDIGLGEDSPELYPVGINLVKMLCTAQADSLFGEWDESIVRFEPRQNDAVESAQKDAAEIMSQILTASNANSMLWELAMDREVYGGAPMKISFDPSVPGRIKWSRVPLDCFFPIWDPDDPETLLEVYVVNQMTRDQAKAKWNIESTKEVVTRIEHWTRRYYTNTLDGNRVDAFSGVNPWGFCPFVYFPRMRTTHWWGDSLTEEVIRPQDELNMRIADLGEAVNYNTHPIRYGYNLPKSFNTKNFPQGPNIFWDLGRTIGQSPEPKVGLLEANNPIPQGTFDYINFIYDWSRTSVFAPPIAFGEDNGGGQRSGITLEIRMWPLIKAVKRSRAYFETGLKQAMRMSALILKQKHLTGIPARPLERLIDGDLIPRFAPVMPRDQAAIVDEITKRMATNPPTISLETATKKLGDGTAEVERIQEMLKDDNLYKRSNPNQGDEEKKPGNPDSAAGNAPKKKAE